MQFINYQIHLFLISKYRLLINLTIILLIYSLLYGGNIIYCMNENPDIVEVPARPEEKAPSHQVRALMSEVKGYAGSQVSLEEELARTNSELERAQAKIKELKQSLENQEATSTRRYFRIQSLKQKFQDARQLNESFSETLAENNYYLNKYREKFGFLGDDVPRFPYSNTLYGMESDSDLDYSSSEEIDSESK